MYPVKFRFLKYIAYYCFLNIIKKILGIIFIIINSSVFANPTGGSVVAGNVSVTQTVNSTHIQQSSQQAIIDWNSFNIGAKEAVTFVQPSGGIILNRIDSTAGMSQIYGNLSATGKIILINPAGIYFGSGASINVGSIIASTANISNANFLAGKYIFDEPSSVNGSIINNGKIIAEQYGLVALLGSHIENNGSIQAELGTILLAAGSKFTLDFTGDHLISFTIDAPATNAKIKNTGLLIANGGQIVVSAQTAETTLDNVINMEGIAVARSALQRHGLITLSANGNISVSGKMTVSGKRHHATGGTISIMGKNIALTATAYLDASGAAGGGKILIGSTAKTFNVSVAKGATLNVNAITAGNGGEISILSGGSTTVAGTILAMGGQQTGNGGAVETSGQYLNVDGIQIDLSSLHGVTGTWLLDPSDLTISTNPTSSVTSGMNIYTANQSSSASPSNINITDLENALVNANILIQTTSAGTGGNGNITVLNSFSWSSANSLTLSALGNISINNGIVIANTAGGTLNLHADNSGTGMGTVIFNGTGNINFTNGGAVNIYYNPIAYTTPTNYSGSVTGVIPTAYMLVNTPANLVEIASNLGGDYALGKNITLSGNFTPIGDAATPFTGKVDGMNNIISGLTITDATASNNVGLFGSTSNAAIINVSLNNFSISETNDASSVGSLVGDAVGTIFANDTAINGAINIAASNAAQSIDIGGLVGLLNMGSMANSSVINSTITASGTNNGSNGSVGKYDMGGLVGEIQGSTLTNSYTSGGSLVSNVNISAGSNISARNEIGGLVGGVHNNAVLQNVYSSMTVTANGNVTLTDSSSVGQEDSAGLIGRLDTGSSLNNAYSTGGVSTTGILTTNSGAGYIITAGLIGNLSISNPGVASPTPSVNNVYSTSNVTANIDITQSVNSGEVLVGGLLGQSNAITANAYSTGVIDANLTTDASDSGYAFYIGGLAGISFSGISNSYSTSPITVTGTNYAGDIQVGGLVGNQITLYDRNITTSFSMQTINVNLNNFNNGDLLVGGLVGSFVYYGSPPQAVALDNDYSKSNITVSGMNNASLIDLGGLVGANGLNINNPGGNITDSYSVGQINNFSTFTNGGVTNVGGFIGYNDADVSATLTNNFWDTNTSGYNMNEGVGNISGLVSGITAGCFSGSCGVLGGTANLSTATTFTSVGWDFNTVWGIMNNVTYPYLLPISADIPLSPIIPAVPMTPTPLENPPGSTLDYNLISTILTQTNNNFTKNNTDLISVTDNVQVISIENLQTMLQVIDCEIYAADSIYINNYLIKSHSTCFNEDNYVH
jgi:filamentous hemagglutinin family protein